MKTLIFTQFYHQDGIQEMIFEYMSGVRSGYQFYTYKNGKVTKMHSGSFTGAGYIKRVKGTKYIAMYQSGGSTDTTISVLKVSKGKLKRVSTYRSYVKNGKVTFLKNGQKISRSSYFAFENKLGSMTYKYI